MNEKEFEEKIEQILKKIESSEFDDLDPKVALSLIGFMFRPITPGGLKSERILEDFKKLEQKVGDLPAFTIGDVLPEDMRNSRYAYLLVELFHTSLKSLSLMVRYGIHSFLTAEEKNETDTSVLTRLKSLLLNVSNEDFVTSYCREWEIQYNNFINPLYERLKAKDLLPTNFKRSGRQSEIDAVLAFIQNEPDFKSFELFINPLDADIRNSLVHCNYFFDKNGEELVYYDRRRKKPPIQRIPAKDFKLKVFHLIIFRLIFTVRVAQKLAEELGIE